MYFVPTGNYYLRLLLDEGGDTKFVNPQEFFNDLYHRFLLSPKPSMKAMCLQAMAIVYGQCYDEIGSFNDTEFVVRKLEQVCVKRGVGVFVVCGCGVGSVCTVTIQFRCIHVSIMYSKQVCT